MRKTISVLALFALARAICPGADYITRYGPAGSASWVFFPGGPAPARLVSIDVTSDSASGTLNWAWGTGAVEIQSALAGTETSVTTPSNAFGSGMIVVFETGASVRSNFVSSVSSAARQQIILASALPIAAPAGTIIAPVRTNTWTLAVRASSNSASIFLSSTAWPLDVNSNVLICAGGGLCWSNSVGSAAFDYGYPVQLDAPLGVELERGQTNLVALPTVTALAAPANAGATSLHVTNSTGFNSGDVIFLVGRAANRTAVRKVASVGTTNITIDSALPFNLAVGDTITRTHPNAAARFTNSVYARPAEAVVYLRPTNAFLQAGTNIVCVPVGADPVMRRVVAVGQSNAFWRLDLRHAVSNDFAPGTVVRLIGGGAAALWAERPGSYRIVMSSGLPLTLPGQVAVCAGWRSNAVVAVAQTNTVLTSTLSLASPVGMAMQPGDICWLIGDTNSALIGQTTVRMAGEAIRTAPARAPIFLWVTGSSAAKVNSATVAYGN